MLPLCYIHSDVQFTCFLKKNVSFNFRHSVESSIQWLLELQADPERSESKLSELSSKTSEPSTGTTVDSVCKEVPCGARLDEASNSSISPEHHSEQSSSSTDDRHMAAKFLDDFHKRLEARFKPSPKVCKS